MITTTSTSPTPDVLPPDAPRRSTSRRPSWGAKAVMVVLIAGVTAGILVLAGVFDTSSSSDINIDPIANKPAVATTTAAPGPADSKVVVEYVAAMTAWNECVKAHGGEDYTKACGVMPEQVDDPNLNAYLSEVLNWNKCASPLLKQGATAQAEAACGPQPAPPTDK